MKKTCTRDFTLRKSTLIGEEPHEIKQRLVGAFKREDSASRVCEDLRHGLHRGFSNRPWFVAIFAANSNEQDIIKSPKSPPFHTYVEYIFG